jgi:hypothetical protein
MISSGTAAAAGRRLLGLTAACLLAAIAALPTTLARAALASTPGSDTQLYDVEMVVFRAAGVPADEDEDWSVLPTPRGFGDPITQRASAPQVLRILTPGDYRLDGVVRGLRRSGSWQPIAHAAWVQTAPPWGTNIGVPLSEVGLQVPGLTGSVYLERAKVFMHLGFDISWQNGPTYTIDEMRNVRQNEKEYFDHPAFGIIAVVVPIRGAAR